MRIGIDAMGGDNAPQAMIAACYKALSDDDTTTIVMYGNQDEIESAMKKENFQKNSRVEIIHCTEFIDVAEHPVQAIKEKPDSSLMRALSDLKEKKIDAFVSSGSTGALLAGSTLKIGRIKGVKRPALTVIMPTYHKIKLLLDVGANADCQAIYLQQFAIMGHFYAKYVLDVKNPDTYLINIGTEDTKGTMMYQEAHKLLQETKCLNFKGNAETISLAEGVDGDVFVCDGFTGNIILKLAEGFMKMFSNSLKSIIYKDTKSKIGGMLMKSGINDFKNRFNIKDYTAAPLLGLKEAVIKCHGNANADEFIAGIRLAKKYFENDIIGKIESEIHNLE